MHPNIITINGKMIKGFPGGSVVVNPLQYMRYKTCGFEPWVGKIPWRMAWEPTPVSLPRESHGQKSLSGYNPWGLKESDITEVT